MYINIHPLLNCYRKANYKNKETLLTEWFISPLLTYYVIHSMYVLKQHLLIHALSTKLNLLFVNNIGLLIQTWLILICQNSYANRLDKSWRVFFKVNTVKKPHEFIWQLEFLINIITMTIYHYALLYSHKLWVTVGNNTIYKTISQLNNLFGYVWCVFKIKTWSVYYIWNLVPYPLPYESWPEL